MRKLIPCSVARINSVMGRSNTLAGSWLFPLQHAWHPARQLHSQSMLSLQVTNQSFLSKMAQANYHPPNAHREVAFSHQASKQTMKTACDHQIKAEWIQLVNPQSTLNQSSDTQSTSNQNINLIEPALTRDVLARLDLSKYTLIQVNPKASPPICKIVSREAMNQKEKTKLKQKKEQKKSNRLENVVKEVQLTWKIGTHDLHHKLKTAQNSFHKGYKVRVLLHPSSRYSPIDDRQKSELLAVVQEQLTQFGGELAKQEIEGGKLIMEWHPTTIRKESAKAWIIF